MYYRCNLLSYESQVKIDHFLLIDDGDMNKTKVEHTSEEDTRLGTRDPPI